MKQEHRYINASGRASYFRGDHDPRTGLGVAVLIGIVGALLGFVQLTFFVAGPIAVAAIVLGFVGRGSRQGSMPADGSIRPMSEKQEGEAVPSRTVTEILSEMTPEAGAIVMITTRDRYFSGARLVGIGFDDDRPEVVVFDDPVGWLSGRYLVPWIEITCIAFRQEE